MGFSECNVGGVFIIESVIVFLVSKNYSSLKFPLLSITQ